MYHWDSVPDPGHSGFKSMQTHADHLTLPLRIVIWIQICIRDLVHACINASYVHCMLFSLYSAD